MLIDLERSEGLRQKQAVQQTTAGHFPPGRWHWEHRLVLHPREISTVASFHQLYLCALVRAAPDFRTYSTCISWFFRTLNMPYAVWTYKSQQSQGFDHLISRKKCSLNNVYKSLLRPITTRSSECSSVLDERYVRVSRHFWLYFLQSKPAKCSRR